MSTDATGDDYRRSALMAFLIQQDDPIDKMRARAEQIRRLAGMADDPAMALDLRCCAAGLEQDIARVVSSSQTSSSA